MAVQALYLHIPFCASKCAYCDFDSRAVCGAEGSRAIASYMRALTERLDCFGECGALSSVRTVYIGGGTPTIAGRLLVDLIRSVLRWCAPVEITCEANPESFSGDLARELRGAGVTRVSLGVQSLNNQELAAIGRIHTARRALEALALAHDLGFDVSCDLMCGLPLQTEESWRATLRQILEASPHHVSVYPLTLEDGTPLAAEANLDETLVPSDDFQAWCMGFARDALRERGYAPYEVASYALHGKECQHNIAYWTGASYLGIGRSASSMFGAGEFQGCLSELFAHVDWSDASAEQVPDVRGRLEGGSYARVRITQLDDEGARAQGELLTAREAAAEDLMLGMRLTRGISRERVSRACDAITRGAVTGALARAEHDGLACWIDSAGADGLGSRFAPTERGWLMGNELFELMWGLAGEGA